MVPEQLRPSGGSKHGPSMERRTLGPWDPPKPQAQLFLLEINALQVRAAKIFSPGSGLNLSNFNPISFRTQSFRGLVPPAFPQVPQKTCCNRALFTQRQRQGFHVTKLDKSQDQFPGKRTPCISTYIYMTLPSYRSTHQAMAHIHLRLPELVQLSSCKICCILTSAHPRLQKKVDIG